jgi:hypothetical protein
MEGERKLSRLKMGNLNKRKKKTWILHKKDRGNPRKKRLGTSKIVSTSILVSTERILIES